MMATQQEADPVPTCQHIFNDLNKGHYCSYIQVPGLLATFYPGAQTVDEILLCAGLSAYVLWWNLQEKELTALVRTAESGRSLSTEECYAAMKQAKRCVEVGRLLVQQGEILHSELVRRKSTIQFRFSSADTNQFICLQDVARLTHELAQQVANLRMRQQAGSNDGYHEWLLNSLKDHIGAHYASFQTAQRDFTDLLWAVYEQPAPRVVPFTEVVDAGTLLSFGKATLLKHHPQAVTTPNHGCDELTFITVHQVFEVWFLPVIRSIQQATSLLRTQPPRVWEAEGLARRVADIFSMFGRMIHIPETMTAADYSAFRGQLKAGSGVESYQFRAIEISAGLRDPHYHHTIGQMRLFTSDLQTLWETPSLNSAFMEVLVDRGICGATDTPEEKARQLAQTLLLAGEPGQHLDIIALAESLVRFEQNVDQWRTEHIAMVARMIGRERGTGAHTYGQLARAKEEHFDSLPYLYNTLAYEKIFPTLWDARKYLEEYAELRHQPHL